MTVIYKSYIGRLSLQTPSGFIIYSNDNELIKVDYSSIDNDIRNHVIYFMATDKYNRNSAWDELLYKDLCNDIRDGDVRLIANLDQDDPRLANKKWEIENNIVSVGYRVDGNLAQEFKDRCNKLGVSYSAAIAKLMQGFIDTKFNI